MHPTGARQRATAAIAAATAIFAITACARDTEPPNAASAGATDRALEDSDGSKSPWESCYSTFSPTGDPSPDLARLTLACGSTGGMEAITEIQTGQQRDADPVDRYTLDVPEAGKCYRIYSAGDGNVQDLDLLLRDPSGADIATDLTHNSWPVLPRAEPLCLDKPGLYMLEVSVHQGSGRYAMQVWGR